MSAAAVKFNRRWLHHGEWNGKEFSHELAEYHHDEHPGDDGATAMRHALVEREGTKIAVWIPTVWTEEQAREAPESNW